jgi:hypothetical protein
LLLFGLSDVVHLLRDLVFIRLVRFFAIAFRLGVYVKWFLIADMTKASSMIDSWVLAIVKKQFHGEFRYCILVLQGHGCRAILVPLD